MSRSFAFESLGVYDALESRISLSCLIADIPDDPLDPDDEPIEPEPDPGPFPPSDPPIVLPPLPPSGPVGPG